MGFWKSLFGGYAGPPHPVHPFGGYARPPHPVHPADERLIADEDRKWFSGLTDKDLKALDEQDNVFRYASALKFREEGLSAEEASRRCWQAFPYFYLDPAQRGQNPLGFDGEDAELPLLIKDRVNRLAMLGSITKELMERHRTMNATIRHLLGS
jgi:hypothetical protein